MVGQIKVLRATVLLAGSLSVLPSSTAYSADTPVPLAPPAPSAPSAPSEIAAPSTPLSDSPPTTGSNPLPADQTSPAPIPAPSGQIGSDQATPAPVPAGQLPGDNQPSAPAPGGQGPAAPAPGGQGPAAPAPAGQVPGNNQPSAPAPGGQGPAAPAPAGQVPGNNQPSAPAPGGQGPAAPAPGGQVPGNNQPSAPAPGGQGPAAPAPGGQGPAAPAPRGQGPSAPAPGGQVPGDNQPSAPAPGGQGPAAPAPGDKPPTLPVGPLITTQTNAGNWVAPIDPLTYLAPVQIQALSNIGLVPNGVNQLPSDLPKLPAAELLVAHDQIDVSGVENGGIQFFGTNNAPQVVNEDGSLTPPAPPPGSGLPIPPDALTTEKTFIGQPGGVTFNAPDVAVPVVLTPLTGFIATVPGAESINKAFNALQNIGNDLSPVTRKKAKKILVTTLVVSQLAALRRRMGN